VNSVKRLGMMAALVGVLGIVPAFGAHAQSAGACTLAAADCTLLTTANSNVGKETSFTQDFDFKVTVKTGTQNVDISATGTGPFTVNTGASMTDMNSVHNAVDMALDITGSTTGTGTDQSGKFSMVITKGVFYFKTDKQDWQGVKLSDALKAAQSQGSSMTGGSSSGAAGQAAALFQDPAILQSLTNLANTPSLVVLTKTANAPTLDGQTMAEFVYTISLKGIATSKDLYPLIRAILKASGSTTDLPDAQLAQFSSIAGSALSNTTFTITRWVGTTDNEYHALGIDLVAAIDPTTLGSSGDPVNANFHLLVKLSKVGQPVTVTAPAGAKMVDTSSMSGSNSGSATMAATMDAAATMVATAAQ